MLINLLLLVLIVVRLWTAGVLFITGRQNKLTNLYWLAGGFVLFAFGAAFASRSWMAPAPVCPIRPRTSALIPNWPISSPAAVFRS